MSLRKILKNVLLVLAASQAYANTESQIDHEIKVDGSTRSYTVLRPVDLPPGKVPLMVVLHGGTGNAHHSSRTMGMNEVAIQNHFMVAYPDGTGTILGKNRRVWNAGACCAIAQRKNINDVKFIDEMIKEILQKYPVDPKRLYVTGESNGAMLTYRLVCDLPDVFAAAIPVSGTLMIDNCKAGQKVALFDVHGSADKNVPYNGGKGEAGYSRAVYRSVPDSIKIIAELRQCGEPAKKTLPNGDLEAEYTCQAGAPVRTRLIQGGGHAWPVASGSGKNSSFAAAEEAWNFAKNFSK